MHGENPPRCRLNRAAGTGASIWGTGLQPRSRTPTGVSVASSYALKVRSRSNRIAGCTLHRGAASYARQVVLKIQAYADLTGAAAAEVGIPGRGNPAEVRAGDVQVRIGEVGVVQDVSKRSFQPHL